MAEYVTLIEAAELEDVKYNTMVRRITRNIELFKCQLLKTFRNNFPGGRSTAGTGSPVVCRGGCGLVH